jgi:hypothetical protein
MPLLKMFINNATEENPFEENDSCLDHQEIQSFMKYEGPPAFSHDSASASCPESHNTVHIATLPFFNTYFNNILSSNFPAKV